MSKYKTEWTEKEQQEGETRAHIFIHELIVARRIKEGDLATAFISSDAYPGIKFIANRPNAQEYEGVLVIIADTGEFQLILDKDIE